MGGKLVLEVSARVLCGRCFLQWLLLVSSKVCGRNPIWEGVWSHLDLMDSVCLRTASVEWNAPGKYAAARRALFLPDSEETGSEACR